MNRLGGDRTATEEATAHLVELVRRDTTNPPGNEERAVSYLAAVLAAEGVPFEVQEWRPHRPNLVARLPGRRTGRPLIFLSHLDVVPADAGAWTVPPFEGVIADGYVWGRGAVDMKHIVAATLTAILEARRVGLTLECDVYFIATSDEESGGASGAEAAFDALGAVATDAIVLSEGGDAIVRGGRVVYLLEIAQKGWIQLDVVRRSEPGHSALPTEANCLTDMGGLLGRVGTSRFPHRVTESVRRMLTAVADAADPAERGDWLGLLDPCLADASLDRLALPAPMRNRIEALLRNHAVAVRASGGEADWSLPSKATLRLSGRVLPGVSEADWLRELEGAVGPLGEHTVVDFAPGVETDVDWALFETLAGIVSEQEPSAAVAPNVLLGGGDLRYAAKAGAQAFGYFPLRPEAGCPSIWELAHGRDERISVTNLARCVELARQAIRRLASPDADGA